MLSQAPTQACLTLGTSKPPSPLAASFCQRRGLGCALWFMDPRILNAALWVLDGVGEKFSTPPPQPLQTPPGAHVQESRF